MSPLSPFVAAAEVKECGRFGMFWKDRWEFLVELRDY